MQNEGNREKQQNKRLKQKLIVVLLALVCILALVLVKKLYIDRSSGRKNAELFGPYKVVRVVDGDTVIADINGEETRIRLIGIDTPESVAPEVSGKENTEEGTEVSDYVKSLLDGKKVFLEYDVSRTDQYGRTLAYVYLEDSTTMLQELLLSEGMAMVETYQPNVKYADYFYKLQKKARKEGQGFWGNGYYE